MSVRIGGVEFAYLNEAIKAAKPGDEIWIYPDNLPISIEKDGFVIAGMKFVEVGAE